MDVREVKTTGGKWFPFFEVAGVGYYLPLIPDGTRTAGEELTMPPLAAKMPKKQKDVPRAFVTADDGKKREVETRLLMVSNSCIFGEKYQVQDPDSATEDALDVSIFKDYSRDDLRRLYAGTFGKAQMDHGNIERFQSCKLKVSCSPRMKVMADGVDLGRDPVTFKVKEGALRIIAAKGEKEFESKNWEAYESRSEITGSENEDPFEFGL
jgi:hypothetical protein